MKGYADAIIGHNLDQKAMRTIKLYYSKIV